ncbi:hypothetical protein GF407_10405 [candidate division KSB1 bacterium]|nr:hypothetical protein [candidate division KSB1 bacterium]
MKIIKEYDAKLDNKKRLTIRGAKYDHYKVRELSNDKSMNQMQFHPYLPNHHCTGYAGCSYR